MLGAAGAGPIQRYEAREATGFLPRGYIDGGICANDTTDATNDLVVNPFVCRSTCTIVNGAASTLHRNQMDLDIPVQVIKQLDVSYGWENYDPVTGRGGGGRSGGRSTSSLADGTWHVLACGAPGRDTGLILHDSLTQSSVLAELRKFGFTAYRNIMSVVRSTSIKPFTQVQDEVIWTTPVLDVNNSSAGTSENTGTLTVPIGIPILARINAYHNSAGGFYISSLSQADLGPTTTAAPLTNAFAGTQASATWMSVITDTSAQFRYRGSASTLFTIATLGFVHPRGRNA